MHNHAPDRLDAVRRQWLDGLARHHAAERTAASAFELARGLYRCGEYEAALEHFTAARDLAPLEPGAHLALMRMASTLGRRELEQEAIDEALRRVSMTPSLALHLALRDVPGDLPAARRRLQAFARDPACAEFAQALALIDGGSPMPEPAPTDPKASARRESLSWTLRHARDSDVFTGLPVDVLQRALDAAPPDGLTLECGVYFGRSLRIIAERSPGLVHGFDSFQGLPEAWSEAEGAGAYSTGGRLPGVPANVRLHAGWFEDTLPEFFAAVDGPIRLLHVDCDLYSSTRTVLAQADRRLLPGSVIVFDDLLGYPGYQHHELRAFEEFARDRGLQWDIIAAALLGREVAVRVTARMQ